VGEELLIDYQADGQERYWEPPEVIDLTAEPVHIKREREYSTGEKGDHILSHCNKCDKTFMQTPTRSKTCPNICNACANKARDTDPARYIARKLADSLRRQGVSKPYPSVHWVREVIDKCEGKSVLSGNANYRHLCIIAEDEDQPLTLENAILVTGGECHSLSRKRAKGE
jgi:hypothetical protein